jgi:hypothetical protein
MKESPRRAAEDFTTADAGGSERSLRSSFIDAADREHDAERLDSVAGSEFVDDRIRGNETDDET